MTEFGRSKMGCNAARAGILLLLSCSCTLAFRTRIRLNDSDLVSDDVLIASQESAAASTSDKVFITNGSSLAAMNHTTQVANKPSGAAMVQEEAVAKTAVAESATSKNARSERGVAQKAKLDKTATQKAAAAKTVVETAVAEKSANRLTTLHLAATTAVATDGVIEKLLHEVRHRVSAVSSACVMGVCVHCNAEFETINWYIVLAYVVLCCTVYGALVWARPAALDGKLDEKKKVENDLEQEFENLVGDLEANLKVMTNLELGFIGHDFEDLRRDFCKFVVMLQDCDDEVLVPLRAFILLWVNAYHDSTLGDAVAIHPLLVSGLELDGCPSVAEVCQLASKRLGNQRRRKSTLSPQLNMQLPSPDGDEEEARVVGLLGCSWLQIGGMNPGFYCAEGEPDQDGYPHTCGMCGVEATFFSPKHQCLWAAFLFGFVFAAVEIALGHMVYPAMILVAQLLLLHVLVRFEHDDAETQCVLNINRLVKKHDKVDKHRSEVRDAVESANKVKDLWMYRSVPYLRLIKAIHDKLEDRMYGAQRGIEKYGAQCGYLQRINAGLEKLDANLGNKGDWYSGSDMMASISHRNDDIIKANSSPQIEDSRGFFVPQDDEDDEEAFKLLGARINEAAKFVFEETLKDTIIFCDGVFDVFSNITVRVVACHGLPKYQSLLDKTDPYVRVRVGACSWNKTKTISNQPDPKWNTENVFCYNPGQRDVEIEVEVMEDHHVRVDKMIGLVKVPFRQLSCGEWHHMVLPLDNAKQGTVEISVKPTSDLHSYKQTLEEQMHFEAAGSEYKFGDLTKGLCAAGREARGDEETASYKFGDLTRGVVTKSLNSTKNLLGSKKNLC